MKFFIFVFFIFLFFRSTCSVPLFSSFPLTPILNYDGLTISILLKCSTPLYISIDGSFKPISDFSATQVLKWFSDNNPIQITTNNSMIILPEAQTASNFDVSLTVQTPRNSSFFIILVGENYFFDINKITVPFSSPLIISRDATNYASTNENMQNNELVFKKYSQPTAKSWEEKNIDLYFKDSSIQTQNSEPFLCITFSVPSSGIGKMVLEDIKINRDGFEYKLDTFTISVSKKDPIYQIPIKLIDKLSVVQEFASRSTTLNISPGDPIPSSREELYGDIINIKSGFLVCLEHPTMFTNFAYNDIQILENSEHWSFYFRKMDNINDIVEYIWDKNIKFWQKVPLLNRGFGCQFQAIRNQYCPYCVNVYHRISKTGHVYNIFRSDNTSYITDFGLDVSIQFLDRTNTFYYKNENENYLGNNFLSINLNLSKEYTDDINNNYFLVPIEKEKDSTLFIWQKEILNGCNGINITYSDFYNQASCQLPQYSCSNVHYFRDTQDQTQKINNNFNYLIGNSRSSINYLNQNLLSIERLQKKLDLSVSIYLTSLPILQPSIDQTSFSVNQDDISLIVINFSFMNNGSLNGDYSINISCNDTTNSLFDSGVIEMNNTKEFSLNFPKSITKSTKYYECNANVLINNQPYWTKFGKEIDSKAYFHVIPKQIEEKCDLQFSNSSIVLTREKEYLHDENVVFLVSIENNIELIDWFKIDMNCLGSDPFSKLVQIPTDYSKSIQISMKSNKSNPKCTISVQSFQIECNYSILNYAFDYKNILTDKNQDTTISLSSSLLINISLLLFPLIIYLLI
uniref:MatD protein n=1 Tax=Dictyostelium discoideum TaxID=44689 RepID=D3UFF8_DICDI|nr:MatD protein [Dictyostelium discoideum]